jgi:fido (protein-threonine AMPylation protein)
LSQEANIQGDPYLYADTSVLRNLADIRDANRLNQFESDHFFARLLELHENPIRGSFDSDHLRHIHHYLFQDVYAWAGEFRTVPIAKGNSFFARPEHIQPELQKLFHQLAGEQFLRGIDSSGFCRRAAHYLGEINALHPFREGNGRAQREFIRELAAEAGYEIAWDLVTQDEMFAASVASFHRGTSDSFATILNKIVHPVR